MFEKIIKDYFSFSKKERIGVLILVLLIIVVAILPYLIPERDKESDKAGLKDLQLQTAQLQSSREIDEPSNNKPEAYIHSRESSFERPSLKEEKPPRKTTLFYFDPNDLSGDGWRKLGLNDKTISIIHNYISKGGRFKSSEDIRKIYGLNSSDAQRLMPYVKITGLNVTSKKEYKQTGYLQDRYKDDHPGYKQSFSHKPIDLNSTDTSELIALPGIGSKLAERIVRFREKLGGFYAVDQLSEIYGLPDSTYQKIKARLTIITALVPSININLVEANELKQHPYIKWNLATAIVEYRRQHGKYGKVEDLRKIDLITDTIYKKIVPYLKVE